MHLSCFINRFFLLYLVWKKLLVPAAKVLLVSVL